MTISIISYCSERGKAARQYTKIPNQGTGFSWRVCLAGFFISRRGAEARRLEFEGKHPLSPIARQGENRSGMEVGTPFPVAFQATRWYRRIRIAPTATRGTDARPRTRIATKSIFAHISCEGLRQPSESRERTPVSNTCHSV